VNHGTCTGVNRGILCSEPAVVVEPVPLCQGCMVQIALQVVPDVLTATLNRFRTAGTGTSIAPAAVNLIASAEAAELPVTARHSTVVYFLANGGRVKIGFTASLSARLRALSLREDAILLLLHGGRDLEDALHAQFAAHRIGTSEWFELTTDVVRFIAGKNPKAPRQTATLSVIRGGGRRRPLTDWVRLTTPVFHHESNRLGRPPTGPEFADAIAQAGYGTVSPSTAKNIRAALQAS
jgi:hypothetical protein